MVEPLSQPVLGNGTTGVVPGKVLKEIPHRSPHLGPVSVRGSRLNYDIVRRVGQTRRSIFMCSHAPSWFSVNAPSVRRAIFCQNVPAVPY
ncbi:hypothetical protein U2F26_34110 [Micromonospora sp. 4G57]|uniref:Uncharacterized protein n=1 Tax=Micromonospora sicca TaxID=2202420 RepID=A0ABU5JPW0_9ACTN|nr:MULTISPECIES: hypothetical protein [unclassified Micromonospora]MDZ5447684.1 hypothetical protein [Micromonospora sp. 4G57]MDZ5494403.1 hypothetical protein [Micromonospora sp. 4G53]